MSKAIPGESETQDIQGELGRGARQGVASNAEAPKITFKSCDYRGVRALASHPNEDALRRELSRGGVTALLATTDSGWGTAHGEYCCHLHPNH